jgi:hypothetical protein
MAWSGLATLSGRPWFWAAVVGVLFGVPLVRGLTQERPPAAPPVFESFPPFALTADDGTAFAAADLHGRVFIADLICGDCAGIAAQSGAMRELQHRTRNLGDAVRLVSFSRSLDAAALRDFRRKQAAGQRWTLLVGAPAEAARFFSGGNMLLLVDGRLRIRGRYGAESAGEIGRLLRDAALLTALQ